MRLGRKWAEMTKREVKGGAHAPPSLRLMEEESSYSTTGPPPRERAVALDGGGEREGERLISPCQVTKCVDSCALRFVYPSCNPVRGRNAFLSTLPAQNAPRES